MIMCLSCVAGHDSKPNSSENLRLRRPSRKQEPLNDVSLADSSSVVSVTDVIPVDNHVAVVHLSAGDRSVRASRHSAVEPTTSGALLRPTLTSSRKGHGHRHRRAMRRASSGVSCGVPLPPSEVDPREPQVVLSESALTSASHSCRSRQPDALQTLHTSDAAVASPAHFDLSSLSSYKETSPESEAAAPSSPRLLKLNMSYPFRINRTEARRRSDNRLSSFSHSRDSLEMYKSRSQRKLSVDGTVLSESAIVHAVAEPLPSSLSNSGDVVNANSTDHIRQTAVALASLQSSDADCLATADDPICHDSGTGYVSADELSLSSIVPEVSAVTSCDDTAGQACGFRSPTESKSESSNTLTPATDVSSNTVRKRPGRNVKRKSAASLSSSRKLSSLFCGASTSSEVGDDVLPAAEANRTDLTALDWSFSTDSDDSPSSGIHIYIHTYMKFITRCIVEDGSNQRRGLLLGCGV